MLRAVWKRAASMLFATAAVAFFQPGTYADSKSDVALHWYPSGTASPIDSATLQSTTFAPSLDSIVNQTIRQTITISRGGLQLRVRFSNEYGSKPLRIAAASIGFVVSDRVIRIPLTFGGSTSVTAGSGSPLVSDAAAITVSDGSTIEISLYLLDPTPISTIHLLGLQQSLVSGPGNFVMSGTLPAAISFDIIEQRSGQRLFARAFLSEVDVAGSKPTGAVVAFGDSITDGMGSTPCENRRWPDYLARRVARAKRNLSVVNQGIGGNQLLSRSIGDSGLARFDRDVLALPGVSTVIVMEGINDIKSAVHAAPGLPQSDSAPEQEIIQGYRQMIARAHARGVRIIGATITPFSGWPTFTPEREATRQMVNEWIRTSGAFDALVDFDAVARDPHKTDRLKSEFDSGDHLHLNDAGYEAMASSIDLSAL